MQMWQRRTLGALALGGSFLGLSLAFEQLFNSASLLEKLLQALFLGLYGWGIWCGIALLENADRALLLNRRFWAIQIPFVSSPIVSYMIASGCLLFVSFHPAETKFEFDVRFGSQAGYSLLRLGQAWAFGVNVFALGVYLFLTWCIRREMSVESLRCPQAVEPNPFA